MHSESVIQRPILLTEKATTLREEDNKVIFRVSLAANKIQIKKAVEDLFDVTVIKVNTSIMRGKERRMGKGYGRKPNWKKAMVTLSSESNIQFFDQDMGDDTDDDSSTEEKSE